MADFVTAGTQTVAVNASVLFAANRIYSCNCPNIRHEALSGRVVSVSYTHLDVYKRQTHGRHRYPAWR